MLKSLALAVLLGATPVLGADYVATSERIGALTGPNAPVDMLAADVCGTDLGTMTEIDGKIVLAFGDTFGFTDGRCVRFGPNWRSNVVAMTADTDPSDGVTIDSWLTNSSGQAIAASEGAHSPKFTGEQTRIPTAMVTVGDTIYLHYMSVHGFADMGGVWLCNSSRFIRSGDGGRTWDRGTQNFGGFESSFNMLALSAQPGTGNEDARHVYAIGTPCGRFGGARAARVLADRIMDNDAWEYFDGNSWVAERSQAVEIIRPGVGEGSLVWNTGLDRWMYTTLNELSQTIELRLAERVEGPWSDPIALAYLTEYPQAYGAYMTPSWITEDGQGFYFVMSQFGPYNTYIMRADLKLQP